MHTEFIPYQHIERTDLIYRLAREMVRQSFLITIRDELGIGAFDGTLREEYPAGKHIRNLVLVERPNESGWRVKLFGLSDEDQNTRGLWDSENEPVWEGEVTCQASSDRLYKFAARTFLDASRNEFVEALMKAGIAKQDPPSVETLCGA